MPKEDINKSDIIKRVFPIIEQAVEKTGLGLLEVDFVNECNKWHLRVYLYKLNNPVTHEDCEKVTAELPETLDELISVPFYLEVSSPGTERKLKTPREYLIFKGYRVKIKLIRPVEGYDKVFLGEISDYTEDKGLEVKAEANNKIVFIEEKNISQIKLEPKYEF